MWKAQIESITLIYLTKTFYFFHFLTFYLS